MEEQSTRDSSDEEKGQSQQVAQRLEELSLQESSGKFQSPLTGRPCNYTILDSEATKLVGIMEHCTPDTQGIEESLCFLYNSQDPKIQKKYGSEEEFNNLSQELSGLYPKLTDLVLRKHFTWFVHLCSEIYHNEKSDLHKKISVYMLLEYAKKLYTDLMGKYEKIRLRKQRAAQEQ